MAAPTVYRSSDGSAPVLTGTAGDLVNLLDKCLVDGYGAKSGAGWSKAFTASNQRSYRQGAGSQFYLDVDDRGASGVLTGTTPKEAAVRGYEVMTAVSTGTNPFPTAAQLAVATSNWRKSVTADTVPRGWWLIADDRTFTLAIQTGDVVGAYYVYHFGDFYSYKASDAYKCAVSCRTTVNAAGTAGTVEGAVLSTVITTGLGGWFEARIAAGTGTSVNFALCSFGTTVPVSDTFPAVDGNEAIVPFYVGDVATPSLRGYLRGIYRTVNPVNLNDGDAFAGTGAFAGRTFIYSKGIGVAAAGLMIETTAWDTSS